MKKPKRILCAVLALLMLLGAAALGDIGQHFPDNDPAYKGRVCPTGLCSQDRG